MTFIPYERIHEVDPGGIDRVSNTIYHHANLQWHNIVYGNNKQKRDARRAIAQHSKTWYKLMPYHINVLHPWAHAAAALLTDLWKKAIVHTDDRQYSLDFVTADAKVNITLHLNDDYNITLTQDEAIQLLNNRQVTHNDITITIITKETL